MILAQILKDALVEIVITIAGDGIDQRKDADVLLRGWLLISTQVEQLDMWIEDFPDIDDRIKGLLVSYKWVFKGKYNLIDAFKPKTGWNYQDRDIGSLDDCP